MYKYTLQFLLIMSVLASPIASAVEVLTFPATAVPIHDSNGDVINGRYRSNSPVNHPDLGGALNRAYDVSITLSSSAINPVIINDSTQLNPGDTTQFSYDFSTSAGHLEFDVRPAAGAVAGISDFQSINIKIPSIVAYYIPSGQWVFATDTVLINKVSRQQLDLSQVVLNGTYSTVKEMPGSGGTIECRRNAACIGRDMHWDIPNDTYRSVTPLLGTTAGLLPGFDGRFIGLGTDSQCVSDPYTGTLFSTNCAASTSNQHADWLLRGYWQTNRFHATAVQYADNSPTERVAVSGGTAIINSNISGCCVGWRGNDGLRSDASSRMVTSAYGPLLGAYDLQNQNGYFVRRSGFLYNDLPPALVLGDDDAVYLFDTPDRFDASTHGLYRYDFINGTVSFIVQSELTSLGHSAPSGRVSIGGNGLIAAASGSGTMVIDTNNRWAAASGINIAGPFSSALAPGFNFPFDPTATSSVWQNESGVSVPGSVNVVAP